MKKKTILVTTIGLLAVLMTLVLSGCTTYDNFKEAFFDKSAKNDNTITVGILEPQTGADSEQGQLEIDGILLANDVLPEILGKNVEFVYADTQSNIYTAETAIQDLLQKKPDIVLGSYGDVASLAASEYIEDAKVPAITITAANPLITLNNKYYFRTSFSEASQGYALADYVYNRLRQKNAAVIRIDGDETADPMIAKFEKKLKDLTGDSEPIKCIVDIDLHETDYTAYVNELKDSHCKAAFMPVDIKTAEKIFEIAARETLTDITFVLPKDLHNDELIGLKAKYPGIRISVASDFSNNMEGENALYDQFLKAYKEKFGDIKEPNESVALAFDAYMIAAQAIEKAKTTEGEALRAALLATSNYEGASGEISFNENGDPTKPINIDVIKNASFVSVYTVK